MIGNDLVDLNFASIQSNWQRRGFLNKVFSESEQEIIWSHTNRNKAVWVMWSMKEAAYKAHQRRHMLPRRLNWKDQNCEFLYQDGKLFHGVVDIQGDTYYTTTETSSETLYTTAKSNKKMLIRNVFFRGTMTELRKIFIKDIARIFKFSEEDFSIKKNEHGVPILYHGKEEFLSTFSFTGHGKYAAFSLSLTIT